MAKENPAIKPRPKLTFGQWILALVGAAILLFGLHLTGIVNIPFFNTINIPFFDNSNSGNSNSNVQEVNQQGTDSSQEKTAVKSIYEGTYEGKFNYEYNPTCPVREIVDKYGRSALFEDGTGWIPATLTLRVKLGTNSDSPWRLDVLNIWVDDPDFGTGPDGVAPISPQYKNEPAEMTMVLLPRDPSDPMHKWIYEDPKTHERTSLDDLLPSITFRTPSSPDNLADQSNSISIYGVLYSGGREGYYISEDGSTLHSTHLYNSALYDRIYKFYDYEFDDTWFAQAYYGNGLLSRGYDSRQWEQRGRVGICQTRFVSWTLTRISDS